VVSKLIERIKLTRFIDKLRDPSRRRKIFVRMAQDEIAMQIRALREERGYLTQATFAEHAGMQQSAVSRIENADYQGWTMKTLFKVANALDARLRVSFERAEDVVRRFDHRENSENFELGTEDSSDRDMTQLEDEDSSFHVLESEPKRTGDGRGRRDNTYSPWLM
jgi:transcriptional regulator with XRE-family HTH domain